MLELVYHNTIHLPTDANLMMAIATVLTNVPILMIYLSRVLPIKYNKNINIIAAVFTFCFITLGGSITPSYIILASIETVILILIIKTALQWDLQLEKH